MSERIADEAEIYVASIVLADEIETHLTLIRIGQLKASFDEQLRIFTIQMRDMASAMTDLAAAFAEGEEP